MKILTFAASNNFQSINKKLVVYAGQLLKSKVLNEAKVSILDLNDYEMPIYRQDRESSGGIPQAAHDFYRKIGDADALIISFAEHNGMFSAAYKNLFDWASRINKKVYQNKPVILLATSPGRGGGTNVLNLAVNSAPHFDMDVKGKLSIPEFSKNFDIESGHISNPDIDEQLVRILKDLIT